MLVGLSYRRCLVLVTLPRIADELKQRDISMKSKTFVVGQIVQDQRDWEAFVTELIEQYPIYRIVEEIRWQDEVKFGIRRLSIDSEIEKEQPLLVADSSCLVHI